MQFDRLKRREFITLLGGATAAWPIAAQAQQTAIPVIGFLNPASSDGYTERLRAFRQGLKDTGNVERENVTIEYYWGENQVDRLPTLAAELVRRPVSVIAAASASAAFAAKGATTTIPIAFVVAEDPVRLGLVASLPRPGGNMTGVNFLSAELVAKRLEFLRQVVPAAGRVAVLVNPFNASRVESTLRDAEAAGRAMQLQIQVVKASTSREIEAVFSGFVRERPDALLVGNDPLFTSRRVQLTQLAAIHRLPATYAVREIAEVGGLMSYGASLTEVYREFGVYAGRLLKGVKPADLPVLQPTKFELVINLPTARALGLEVPPTLLARADEVIE
jgi:putative ABC transport system substrate-binding protein